MTYDRTTLLALIRRTKSRIQSAEQDNVLKLTEDIAAEAESFLLTDPTGRAMDSVRPGSKISIDLEVFYVQERRGREAIVIPAYDGSSSAIHLSGAKAFINSRYTDFDIQSAINDDLNDLSAQGLYQVKANDVIFNPTITGYDLAGFGSMLEIMSVRYRVPNASRRLEFIPPGMWELLPQTQDAQFPSGRVLEIYEGGSAGLPIHVTYKAPFDMLEEYADDVVDNSGLPATAVDLPPLGAMIALVSPREIERNDIEAQPDPRKATEVVAGNIMNSVAGVMRQRSDRINVEKRNLRRLHSQQRERF